MTWPRTESWPADAVAQLRALWADGLSGQAIATRMGRSRNAVVGKAHRLGLEDRGNPVGRTGPKPGTAPKAYAAQRARYLAAQAKRERQAERQAPPQPAPVRQAPPPPPRSHAGGPLHYPAAMGCQWPSRDAPARFTCAAPRVAGRPYCAGHCRKAYARPVAA